MDQLNTQYLEGLKEFLRIPSISTLSEHVPDIRRAAEFVAREMRDAGLTAEFIEAEDRHPLVYGEWLGAEGKPTLLVYGHYDVQPVDPLNEWISPPFEPAIRGEDIFARGAVDDKGQVYLLLKAIAELKGKLAVNLKVLIEGEEESGGEHIAAYVAANAARLKAGAAIICDTEMFAPGLPTICTGLRGIVYGEIHVESAKSDLHSGMYGGVAPNAIMAAAEIVTALKDPEGRIAIPGFFDRVATPAPEEKIAWEDLPFDEAVYARDEVGVTELTGERGFDVFDRTWARPTFEVHGIRGGFTGEGAKTVIPARAVVKVSARLVPNQDPHEAEQQIAAAVTAATPRGVKAEFKPLHSAPPSVVDPNNRFVRTAAEAMEKVFGHKTVYIRSGGSIPIVGLFDKHLGIPSVMMGFGLPDDRIHAPNEKFHLPNFFGGIRAVRLYLEMLGA